MTAPTRVRPRRVRDPRRPRARRGGGATARGEPRPGRPFARTAQARPPLAGAGGAVRAVRSADRDRRPVQAPADFMDEASWRSCPRATRCASAYERSSASGTGCSRSGAAPGEPDRPRRVGRAAREAGAALMRPAPTRSPSARAAAGEEFSHLAGYGLERAVRARTCPRRTRPTPRRRDPRSTSGWPSAGPTSCSAGPRWWDRTATTWSSSVRDLGARAAGSHGETWATALCLRLGLAEAVERELGEPPLLLVDDPFSALDPERRRPHGRAARGARRHRS